MKVFRLTLMITTVMFLNRGFAQQRPGIRALVNPPNGCYVMEPRGTESPYSFINAEIQALLLTTAGEKANREVLTATGHSGDFFKQAALIESFGAGKYKPADR